MIVVVFIIFLADPIVTLVMFRAKDGGSIHRLEHLNEIIEWHRFIKSNFSVDYGEGESERSKVTYADFCGAFCDANVAIEYFAVSYVYFGSSRK